MLLYQGRNIIFTDGHTRAYVAYEAGLTEVPVVWEKSDFVTVSGKVDNDTKPEFLYRKCGFTGEDIWHILTKKRKNR